MAAVMPPKGGKKEVAEISQQPEACSVCLDIVTEVGERSIAKLKCGHQFHLDCIGSAFNAKGAMQCPNCRHVEDGHWLYANGHRWVDDIVIEDAPYVDDDYEVYQAIPDFLTATHSHGHDHEDVVRL